MNHPVRTPAMTPIKILRYLRAFVFVSTLPSCSAILSNCEPMKICSISLGLTMVVARAKEAQCTVGNVAMAPLEREYGNGHSLIMTRSLRPSCFSVRDNAAKRLSFAIRRWTILFKRLRERIKETVLPTIVALAAMNQLDETCLA